MIIVRFFIHISGADNPSGAWYGWWSGMGSDLTEFAIVIVLWRHINCPIKGCWRPAVRKAGDHRVCSRHHPDGHLTADHIQTLYGGDKK